MEKDFARLKGRVYTDQINLSVEHEFKVRFRALKRHGIDISEESRKALRALVERLEKLTNKAS